MQAERDRVLDLIGKLLAKAESTQFQAEKDAFWDKINELLLEHRLTVADIRMKSPEEKKISRMSFELSKEASHVKDWKVLILGAFEKLYPCRIFTVGSNHALLIGDPDELQVIKFMWDSIVNQLENVVEVEARRALDDGIIGAVRHGKIHGRTWRRDFLIAAGGVVAERIYGMAAAQKAAMRNHSSSSALIIMKDTLEKVERVVSTMKVHKRDYNFDVSSTSALVRGERAGRQVNLNPGLSESSGERLKS